MAARRRLRRKPSLEVQEHKVGRRLYGAFVTLADGRRAYMAYRRNKEIFRTGCSSITEAIVKGIAAWAIDVETVDLARVRGVPYIGVFVYDTGDIYLTRTEHLMDKTKVSVRNYGRRGGSLQRYLPLHFWQKREGSIVL